MRRGCIPNRFTTVSDGAGLFTSQADPGERHSPGSASLLNSCPGRLKLVARIGGEWKLSVSLTAGTAQAKARIASGFRGDREVVNRNFQEAHMRLLNREISSRSTPGGRFKRGLFNCSEKFAEAAKRRPGYGAACRPKRFQSAQRVRVAEAGAVLERDYGRSGVFITLTVPGTFKLALTTIAHYSGYILKRIRQWFRDVMRGPHGVIGVWEYQKRGALHLHFAVMSADVQSLERLRQGVKNAWALVLKSVMAKSAVDVCESKHGFSWLPEGPASQQHAVWIEKSVARYLSKYCSKQAREGSTALRANPSAWVTVDRVTARAALLARTVICMEGFDVEGWRRVVRAVADNLAANAVKTVEFKNPYVPSGGGFVAFGETVDNLKFVELVIRVVDCFETILPKICY